MDCGPTCLRMISRHCGKHYNTDTLRQMTGFSKQGTSLLGISDTAEKIGFRTRGVKILFEQLDRAPLPCTLHWDQYHFVVLTKLTKRIAQIADPAKGVITFSKVDFLNHWISTHNTTSSNGRPGEEAGIALLLEPTPLFYELESQKEHKLSWGVVLQYLRSVKWPLMQVFMAFIVTSLMQLIFLFLTQSIVDPVLA